MEEKKVTKISLSTYIITILIMLVIISILITIIIKNAAKPKEEIVNSTSNTVANTINTLVNTNKTQNNNVKENTKLSLDNEITTDDKTVSVFKFNSNYSDILDCYPYLLLWGDTMLLANGENIEAESTIGYATYKINGDNSITLTNITTQDNAFYNAAEVSIDTINGKKVINFADGYGVLNYEFVKNYYVGENNN